MTEQQRGHHLIVTKEADFDPEDPYYDTQILCLAPEKCGGWWECREPHEVDGRSAEAGPWNSEDCDPWVEEEEFTFHGVEHTWRWGYGWTVPYPGCVVAVNDSAVEGADELAQQHGEGRYLVDDDWDETTCYLTYVSTVEETP